MRMTGEERIAAPRAKVWAALNDPDVLRQCIPGCQSLDKEADDKLRATVEIKIGPIGARFNGAVTLSDIDAPNGYTITGEGQGGTVGHAKGGAKVRLSDDGAGTLLSYEVNAEVGGRLAQLGGPIIDATAKQLAGKFFKTFNAVVSGAAPAAIAPAISPSTDAPAVGATAPSLIPAPLIAGPVAAPSYPWAWTVSLILAIVAGFLMGRSPAADWWVVAVAALLVVAASVGYAAGKGSRT
ncbi:carbon monoxide dehydrogenase subunit G [Sphingobium sufflavum]|uniref:CoxG family protein n=1 Tax=Sphingobium sufflavum TaxID=1129547 RepID=UPI001F2A52AC|nr:carbon monoxide dehydrogenase subunit G [Sphingobium sufflavum]MCE7796269.1 carbon monoxide dehydrogenase subunit G [Sphingobium sufflavum]